MIEVKNLTKYYGDKKAVNNISFKIEKGQILGFLGPNGAGKSTTMNMLTGYISSTSGQILINGYDILEDPIKAKSNIGYLPEIPPLYVDMTVMEYLNFMYDLKKCKLSRKSHLKDICSLCKITDVSGRIIKNLSKGYRQRVGLAQALIGNPPVLILDEPTVGLDPKQILEIRTLIKKLGKSRSAGTDGDDLRAGGAEGRSDHDPHQRRKTGKAVRAEHPPAPHRRQNAGVRTRL